MRLKIKCLPLILILTLFSCNSTSQNERNNFDPCNCEEAYKDLVDKLESNYIGLAQKRLSNEDKAYEERKANYAKKASKIDAEHCTSFLNDFLSFFEDGHLFVTEYPNYSETEITEIKQEIKKQKISGDELNRMSMNDSISKHLMADSILGGWTDGDSKFVVVKEDSIYKAYILSSTIEGIEPGELKAIFHPYSDGYEVDYYSYGYNKRYVRGNVFKEGVMFRAGNIFWIRNTPSYNAAIETIDKTDFNLPTLTKLDQKHTLITVPSFLVDGRSFKNFIDDNERAIKNSENLIIDIRGNIGGNGIYFPLIETYATQNMKGDRQGLVLASPDNLAYFERQIQYSRKIYKPVVNRIKENEGNIIDGPLYPEKKYKIRESKIKNVAILTDEACASAAESFILHSKKSSTKVKTFGKPTNGMIDYTSVNSVLLNSGKQYIYFGYPTGTLHKEIPNDGYNKTGIIPDVSIQDDVKDKIDFIIQVYQN